MSRKPKTAAETPASSASPPAKPRRRARSVRSDGLATRQLILANAEKLFSVYGFDGVSIRQITRASGVDIALVNYYFDSKENLFSETLSMRVDEMNTQRLALLEQLDLVEGSEESLLAIFEAFTDPFIGATKKDQEALGDYRRLVGLVANSQRWQNLVFEQHYDPIAQRFVEAIARVLPDAPRTSIYWGMSFFLGALANAFAETGRLDRLSGGLCRSKDLRSIQRNLIIFAVGGLLRSAAETEDARKA